LDYFVFGGTDNKLTFFNGATNSGTPPLVYNYSSKVQGSDFSHDGFYLAVAVGNITGNVYVYTQLCNDCGISRFYEATTKTCQPCIAYL
jgi:hypothetical protein